MAGFSIYPRKCKNGKSIFYAQFKLPDGSYTTAKSTGCTSRRAAEKWSDEFLLKNGYPMPGRDLTFSMYAEKFFIWNGRWALDKRAVGKRLSERHCLDTTDLLKRHILPYFGNMKITDIDRALLKQFRNDLFNKGKSSSLINKTLYAIKAILEMAEEDGLIRGVPKIDPAAKRQKEKGILTLEEVNKLFSFRWMSKPIHCHPSKPMLAGYVGNLLVASTGLRLSELQGLLIKELHLAEGYIIIKRTWDSRLNRLNETTKTGRERTVFIPEKVVNTIQQFLNEHPFKNDPDAYLFMGEKKPNEKPAEKVVFVRALFTALEQIGINETERKRRNITFHSWRHFLNSLLINSKIPIQKIQSITGHLTDQMTQHYYHIDDMVDVLRITEAIFTTSSEHIPTQPIELN